MFNAQPTGTGISRGSLLLEKLALPGISYYLSQGRHLIHICMVRTECTTEVCRVVWALSVETSLTARSAGCFGSCLLEHFSQLWGGTTEMCRVFWGPVC